MRRRAQRGTALLSVLLIVAVMAAIAATALDRLGLATRLAGNVVVATQGREWLVMAEELAQARIADAAALDGAEQAALLGVDRSIDLPDGQTVTARIEDGTNCFNVNSLVRERRGQLGSRSRRVFQFRDLLVLLGLPEGRAHQIADAAGDAIDSDQNPRPLGNERLADGSLTPDRALASPDELAGIEGVDAEVWALIRPWLCALPHHDAVSVNVETLRPDQAPLLAMLDRDAISLPLARAQIAARPSRGWETPENFWSRGPLRGIEVRQRQADQIVTRTNHFRLVTRVGEGDSELRQEAFFSVVDGRPRLHARRWNPAP